MHAHVECMKQTNIRQFYQQFPTDDACLEHLFRFEQGHESSNANVRPAGIG